MKTASAIFEVPAQSCRRSWADSRTNEEILYVWIIVRIFGRIIVITYRTYLLTNRLYISRAANHTY